MALRSGTQPSLPSPNPYLAMALDHHPCAAPSVHCLEAGRGGVLLVSPPWKLVSAPNAYVVLPQGQSTPHPVPYLEEGKPRPSEYGHTYQRHREECRKVSQSQYISKLSPCPRIPYHFIRRPLPPSKPPELNPGRHRADEYLVHLDASAPPRAWSCSASTAPRLRLITPPRRRALAFRTSAARSTNHCCS